MYTDKTKFHYACFVDSQPLVENSRGGGAPGALYLIACSFVDSADLVVNNDGKVTVWYRLRSTLSTQHPGSTSTSGVGAGSASLSGPGTAQAQMSRGCRTLMVHRRFNDFCQLEEKLKAKYARGVQVADAALPFVEITACCP